MTEITVSPLPKWVLETFEGKFLQAWLGYYAKGDLVEFSGVTENEDDEDIMLLEMTPDEVKELALMAEEAGTPICKEVARLLNDPVGTDIMNGFYKKIDITAIRMEVVLKDEKGRNVMLDPDHIIHSLVSRFPEQIPYVETSWSRGASFITPAGIENFRRDVLLASRREEYLASMASAAPKA